MKKLNALLLLFICLISTFAFAGCKNNNILDNSVYFDSNIRASVYGSGSLHTLTMTELSSESPSTLKKYLQFEIKAKKEWIYGMHIESIEFVIYCDIAQSTEVEFDISLTGTETGTNPGSSINKFEKTQLPVILSSGIGTRVRIPVNDKIILYSTDSTLTIKLTDTYTDPGFSYSICAFKVTGYHE